MDTGADTTSATDGLTTEPPSGVFTEGWTCPDVPVDWTLEVGWDLGRFLWEIQIARLFDGDLDGDVDLADPVSFVANGLSADGRQMVQRFAYNTSANEAVTLVTGAYRTSATVGDADGLPGAEVAIAWYLRNEDKHRVSAIGSSMNEEHFVPDESTSNPWLADLNTDGSMDLLTNVVGVDLHRGTPALPQVQFTDNPPRSVAVDLDLDGEVEVLTAVRAGSSTEVGVLDAEGEIPNPCVTYTGEWTPFFFAVGQFDFDDEGEFVVVGDRTLTICDTNGDVLVNQPHAFTQSSMLGIADLDGDGRPEILFTGSGGNDAELQVLDDQLRPLWDVQSTWWLSFTVADLDGDGDHEVLVLDGLGLSIRDGDGSELARFPPSDSPVGTVSRSSLMSTWMGWPRLCSR